MNEAQAVLALFERAHGEVVEYVRGCSLADWRSTCAAEGWTVASVVAHIADGYTSGVEWMQNYLAGHPVTVTHEETDSRNAARAAPGGRVTPEQAIDLLESRAQLVREVVGGLSEEQLAITFPLTLAGGREVSLAQLTGILVRHTSGHLTSCRAASSEVWSAPPPR